MKKTLSALVVAAGVIGFAGAAFAGCAGHQQTVQSSTSKPIVTADAEQSTPVVTTTTAETAEN